MSPVTTVAKLHHLGIPVSDMERSLAWYQEVLGLIDADLRAGGSGEEISTALQVQGAELSAAFLRIGEHTLLELLEYKQPRGAPMSARNCDVGTIHVCFEVDDVDDAYERLSGAGVEFNGPPIHLSGPEAGDLDGYAFAYFRDPDGIQLELFQLP